MTSGAVFWFTGLSGAGKTTIADGAAAVLREDGWRVATVDGDTVRRERHRHLGFSRPDIEKNNALIAELCAEMRQDHDLILVPIISPYAVSRERARAALGDGFFEIFVAAGIDTVVARDVKGLYGKAARNEITDMIGYSPGSVYEAPTAPDLLLDTETKTAETCIAELCAFARARSKGTAPA